MAKCPFVSVDLDMFCQLLARNSASGPETAIR